MSSKTVGNGLASLGVFIFLYYSTWIFIVPFADSSHWVHGYFIDKVWAVRIPQALLAVGLFGILMLVLAVTICSKKQKIA
ncbi:hypothetical protein SteCoe_30544 [Stentor coeruleus]|uniref:Dolichol phosphate-mannose biosynthesis regulatory protein n=1 Tax=Stentor coeruleus TaxID=5963 RepID=A0A1R2B3B6_9CILI|nr:hypothetical protein SteCoe_30544 [Stentor coeruleus]